MAERPTTTATPRAVFALILCSFLLPVNREIKHKPVTDKLQYVTQVMLPIATLQIGCAPLRHHLQQAHSSYNNKGPQALATLQIQTPSGPHPVGP
jgi:hypothetical protein